MPDPRIIFVNRVYWPSQAATAQLLTDLAEGLAARGWVVHVIATGTEVATHNGVFIHRTGAGEHHAGLLSRMMNYWRFSRRARELLATLVQSGDIIVPMTDPPLLGSAVTRSVLKRGARVVHWIQDIYPEILAAHWGIPARLPLQAIRHQRNNAWHAAHFCVTLGSDMTSVIARQGVPQAHLAVVPNWAPRELDTVPSAAAVAARRSTWELADKFIVAYSGNLGRVHDFSTIIEAAEELKSHPEIVFLFIGRGAQFDQVRATAKQLDLTSIRFLPPASREALPAALAAADAHLVTLKPAFADLVFPSKLAGVLAAGRPVLFVGPPEGDIARLLVSEDCGMTVAPGNGRRLAEVILEWQSAPVRRHELGQHARGAYEKHFSLARALTQWEEILHRTTAAANNASQ